MKREHFVEVVEEALDSLPQELRSHIQNIAILVKDVRRTSHRPIGAAKATSSRHFPMVCPGKEKRI
jgi:ribosomal protein S9